MSGEGGGVRGDRVGGGRFFVEIPKGEGGGLPGEGGGGEGAGRVCARNLGGAKYFFSGPKCPPGKLKGNN